MVGAVVGLLIGSAIRLLLESVRVVMEAEGRVIGAAISFEVEPACEERSTGAETVVFVRFVRSVVLGAAAEVELFGVEVTLGRLGVIGAAMVSRGTVGATRVGVCVAALGMEGADRTAEEREVVVVGSELRVGLETLGVAAGAGVDGVCRVTEGREGAGAALGAGAERGAE